MSALEALSNPATVVLPPLHTSTPSKSVHVLPFKVHSLADLLKKQIPTPRFLLEGILPESGLVILAGAQKLGKSWWALSLALAVVSGGRFLNRKVEQGGVLYLALEDNDRRMQARALQLLEDEPDPETMRRFHYTFEVQPFDLGGLDAVRDWLEQAENPRLVIVDVLRRAYSSRLDLNDYSAVTAALGPLQRLAQERNVLILVVSHTKKGFVEGGDPFERVLGSTAICSVADATLVLSRDRMQNGAVFYTTGRDIAELELALTRDPLSGLWSLNGDGDPKKVKLSPLQNSVLEAIGTGINTNKTLCEHLGKSKQQLSTLLGKLVEQGHVMRQAGLFLLPTQETTEANPDPTEGDRDQIQNPLTPSSSSLEVTVHWDGGEA